MFYRPTSFWTWALAVVTFIEAATVLAVEVALYELAAVHLKQLVTMSYYYYAIATLSSLVLLSLASVYQLLLLYDTLARRNTIQLIGLCIYAALLCVYAVLQIHHVDLLFQYTYYRPEIRFLAISIGVITGSFTAIISAVSWKVYGEFRWTVFQRFNADMRMQRRYFTFQMFLTLLKFDLLYQIGYLVQILAINASIVKTDHAHLPPYDQVVIACIPLTVINVFISAYWVRHENTIGMLATVIPLNLALIALFIYENMRIRPRNVWLMVLFDVQIMTYFGSITLILTVATLVFAVVCTINFRKGLMPHVSSSRLIRNLEEEYEMRTRNLEHYQVVADL